MKLAILIGVAKYTQPVSDLAACKNDVDLMESLLKHTNKFSDIVALSTSTSSAEVKTQLAQFVSKYKDQAVDELFFYYSGHGDLFKDDFYYLFSDFSEGRRNQTSLTNEELDSMLRTLSPKLTIKVVDACHAGVTYVKEANALAKQLQSSKGRFTDCYFMYSSQSSQTSLQDDKLSDFTEAFVEACTTFVGQDIRYKDIIDHISDAFATNTEQTPTFVIQAPCVEIFATINDEIRKLSSQKLPTGTRTKPAHPEPKKTIAEIAAEKAKEYCTREEVVTFIQGLAKALETTSFTDELSGMYTLTTETSDSYEGVPSLSSIGKWIEENGADTFAKVVYKKETYEAEELVTASSYIERFTKLPEYKTVTKTRVVPGGFACTAESPYQVIKITTQPKYDNLPHGVAVCVFVFSKKDFYLFYILQTVKEIDWGKFSAINAKKWTYMTVQIKSDPTGSNTAKELVRRFETFLTAAVKERLGLTEEAAPAATAPQTTAGGPPPPADAQGKES